MAADDHRLELVLTFARDSGEVVILWRVGGEDWRLAPAPADAAPSLRWLRAWLLDVELVSEPEQDLLAPVPQLESLAGPDYPAAAVVEAAGWLELEDP